MLRADENFNHKNQLHQKEHITQKITFDFPDKIIAVDMEHENKWILNYSKLENR